MIKMRSITRSILFLLLSFIQSGYVFSQASHGRGILKISANGHYLQYQDGTPFFWLGDTGWELFSRLTREEIEVYLDKREQQGFNVIQAVILANTDKPLVANQYGDIPLIDNDPEKPNEKYFRLVDWVVKKALEKDMFIALLPTWGGRVSKLWSKGDVIFNKNNAYDYGLFLGKRYKEYSNVIWIAGGDRPAFTDSMDWRPVWRSMIRGINEGTGGKAMITYHPWGEHSSSEYWTGRDSMELDINMIQSGHARRDFDVWNMIDSDYRMSPTKPVLDGEPNYEDHPVNWDPKNGYFRAYDVRKQIYRSVFSGACGVTYGHQAVWQFYSNREKPIVFPDRYWTEALDRPGAFQAGYLKKLILSKPSLERVPDQSIIAVGQGKRNAEYATAFRGEDSSYAMIYLPVGKEIVVNTSWLAAEKVLASWFNPRTGQLQKGVIFDKKPALSFVPPSTGPGNDWVLILERNIVKAKLWGRFEIKLENNRLYQNPFTDVELRAEFISPDGRKVSTWGFYDGSKTWRLRFMPDQIGKWTYSTWFSDRPSEKVSGVFTCISSDIPGMISTDQANPVWFGYKGGKHIFVRSFQVGDRFFASNWPSVKREAFLNWAVQNKYNTLSIASHYLNRTGKGRGAGWNTPALWDSIKQQPDPAEYAKMERILDDLATRKLIVFPFGGFFGQRSGYPRDHKNQLTYIKYTLARLGAYWNLLLNVSGPEPMLNRLHEFTKAEIDAWGKTIDSLDIYGHLLTVHNVPRENPFVDEGWASYQCVQGPKTVNLDSLYWGLLAVRNPKEPLYAQETLWYGNIYHQQKVGHEYTDEDLRRNAWVIAMAGAALNFADNNGNSSSGFSGTLNLSERHQDKHEIIKKVWDFFASIPFYQLYPSPDLVNHGYCLAKPGETYLVYLPHESKVTVNIMPGHYQGKWIKASDTRVRIPIELNSKQELQTPSNEDWVLYLIKN